MGAPSLCPCSGKPAAPSALSPERERPGRACRSKRTSWGLRTFRRLTTRWQPALRCQYRRDATVDSQKSASQEQVNGSRHKWRWLLIAAIVFAGGLAAGYRYLATQRDHARSLNCASSICSIAWAGRLYANDHGGLFPTNFTCFSDELMTPKVLRCSADLSRQRAADWPTYTDANSSYEILAPGVPKDATNTAFLRCRVHGHLAYTDETVFDGVRRRRKFD